MNGIAIGLGLLVVGMVVVFLAWPWRAQPSRSNQGETANDQYEAVLTALRDLEFDLTLGKVAEEDYEPLRQDLLIKAAGLIAQLDEQAGANLETRNMIPCRSCGQMARPDDLYCASCGIILSSIPSDCPQCGREVGHGDLFCRRCGAELVFSQTRLSLERTLEVRA